MSDVFLMITLGSWVFERKTTEVKCHFYPVIPRDRLLILFIAVDDLDHLAEVVPVRFLIVKLFSLCFPYCIVWKEITAHLQGRVSM